MKSKAKERLRAVGELVETLKISKTTIWRWIYEGKIHIHIIAHAFLVFSRIRIYANSRERNKSHRRI
jgi:predicted site-specific integrase-resolvase